MYSFDSRVRYSEIDESRKLSTFAILNYFQDCTTFHGEDVGLGLDLMQEQKRAWWLSGWNVYINRQPELGEKIRISTWPYLFKGIYGFRCFAMFDEAGEMLAAADSCWFSFDLEKNRPLKITEDMVSAYHAENDRRIDLPDFTRRLKVPKELADGGTVVVGHQHLDTNHHVNNAQYVNIARDLLPSRFHLKELKAEYIKAAQLGDVIVARTAEVENGVFVSLQNPDGEIYANVYLGK